MSDVLDGRSPDLAVDTVGGVTVLTPARPRPGNDVTAVLTFRVGVADEVVTIRGITHLVEHLGVTRFWSDALARGRPIAAFNPTSDRGGASHSG